MADMPLVKKLLIKPGHRVLVLNAPEGFVKMLAPLPDGVTLEQQPNGTYDCVQLFVTAKVDLERDAAKAIKALKPDGLLWIAYPKKSSKIKTDITRDVGWEAVYQAGWGGVSLISIDDTWSSMRFKPGVERR